ncbi:MAG TPA: DNA primase [Steroidobacteraceae bacterium]
MAGLIPQSFIDDLIARTDIVELIGSRVPLKKSGREWKACCPFHVEKTPSFWVSPDKQFYHCFGCAAHGTALGFLMNYERLAFPEAVEELAARLGVDVPREADGQATRPSAGNDLYDLMARVASFYAAALKQNARAGEYVTRRGISGATLENFVIGYAPDSWNDVLKRFGASESKLEELNAAGLIIERDRGQKRDGDRHYDRFRDRLMFPIRDARGRTIAFGGRVIDQGEPKYLNSPETVLFHKGRELYGLYEVRQSRAALSRLLVVEGYMDVVRLHQAGITYAVATLGTATTAEHLKRVFRLVSAVVFCFDGDRAGRGAAWRALQNALPEAREGREIRFLFLPEGHDPDSLVGEEGREAFERRLGEALPLSEYLVSELAGQVDLKHADGRARFAELARPLVARVPDGVYRELLLARLGEVIKLPADRLDAIWQRAAGAARPALPAAHAGAEPSRSRVSAGRGGLVRQAVRLLLHFPEIAARLNAERCAMLPGITAPGADVLRSLVADLRLEPAKQTAQVLERWREQPQSEHLSRLAASESLVPDAAAAARELDQALDRLNDEATRKRIDELLQKGREIELDPREKLELQRLMSSRSFSPPTSPLR